MGDADLRALEQQWKASGSVADEAAWLRARFRAGLLPAATLGLAAYLGHPAAELATALPPLEVSVAEWVLALATWGDPLVLRAVAVVGRARLGGSGGEPGPGQPPGPHVPVELEDAFGALEAWCAAPSEELARLAAAAGGLAAATAGTEAGPGPGEVAWLLHHAGNAAASLARGERWRFEEDVGKALRAGPLPDETLGSVRALVRARWLPAEVGPDLRR